MEPLAYFQPPAEIAKVANYAITPAYVGSIYTNEGAPGEVDLTLPAGAPGLTFGFYTADAQILKVLANGSEVIVAGDQTTTPTTGSIQNATPGFYVRVRWLAGKWVATDFTGEWNVT